MTEKFLLEVQERFQLTNSVGLVIVPDFDLPSGWKNIKTIIRLETPNGMSKKCQGNFIMTHFNIADPNISIQKRWRVVLSLPKAKKTDINIGSKIFVNRFIYDKIVSKNNIQD